MVQNARPHYGLDRLFVEQDAKLDSTPRVFKGWWPKGVMEGILYITFEGNRQACYVWWNDSDRKANLNWVSNFDNSNDWFVFRNSLHFSPVRRLADSGEFCFVS